MASSINLNPLQSRPGGATFGGVGCGGCTDIDAGVPSIEQDGLQNREVYGLCAAESGQLEPDEEDGLEGEIPGNIVEHDTEGKALCEVEGAEDDPICEPLNVVLVSGGLESLEGEVCWDGIADKVGYRCGKRVHEMEKSEKENTSKYGICFRNLGAFLESGENGVVRELFVELADIVVGLIRCLYEGGVLLNLLRSGHDELRI